MVDIEELLIDNGIIPIDITEIKHKDFTDYIVTTNTDKLDFMNLMDLQDDLEKHGYFLEEISMGVRTLVLYITDLK